MPKPIVGVSKLRKEGRAHQKQLKENAVKNREKVMRAKVRKRRTRVGTEVRQSCSDGNAADSSTQGQNGDQYASVAGIPRHVLETMSLSQILEAIKKG